jgi:hypothetical protein
MPQSFLAAATLAVMLPIQAFGQTHDVTVPGLLREPRVLRNAIAFASDMKADNDSASEGVYAELGQMVTGSGWISAGPGYRRQLFGGAALVDVSGAVSWRFYKVAQARIEMPARARDRVRVGAQMLWRDATQVSYFGVGPHSSESLRSDYRLQASNLVGYVVVRSEGALSATGTGGLLSRPSISSSTGPFDRGVPDTTALFAQDPAVALARHPRYSHGSLTITRDTRNHPGHPTAGGLYRAAWLGFHDNDEGAHTFGRYETEAAHFVPLFGRRLVLAGRALGVFSTSGPDHVVPFYFLPSLGGNNTLRGYADYRFHDRHLVVANLESRVPVWTHMDGALFFDAGNVAAEVSTLNLARTSYGAGVRLHTGTSTLARLDVARSHEGWRIVFRLSDPLRLARLSRRTAPIPFVP